MNKKSLIILCILLCGLFAGAFWAFRFCDFNIAATNDAVVEPEQISINAIVDGKIKNIFVKPEQNVTSGQLVAEIEVSQTVNETTVKAENAVINSKKKLEEAEENYTNFALMYKDGVISQQEYDESLEKLVSARKTFEAQQSSKSNAAGIKKSRINTVTKKIYAPKDGTVSINYLVKGDEAPVNTPIMLLTTDKPKIVAYFNPKYRDELKEGELVSIKSTIYKGKIFEGVVEKIASEPEMHENKKSQVIPVVIRFKGNISGYSFDKDSSFSVSVKK